MLKNVREWYRRQDTFVKAGVWLAIVLIIGIIVRWGFVKEGVTRGFNFYKK